VVFLKDEERGGGWQGGGRGGEVLQCGRRWPDGVGGWATGNAGSVNFPGGRAQFEAGRRKERVCTEEFTSQPRNRGEDRRINRTGKTRFGGGLERNQREKMPLPRAQCDG